MDEGYEVLINACILKQVFPSTILHLIERQSKKKEICVLVSSYILDRTAMICELNGMGYFDYARNCWFVGHSIYLFERRNKNPRPKEYKAVTIFEKSSVVSSFIYHLFCVNCLQILQDCGS